MPEIHVPKGVSRETLLDVVRGWYETGAAESAVHTASVADHLGLADSVSRQTRFLESLGVLEAEDQQHRLTDDGARLGSALSENETATAVETLRGLLADWAFSDALHATLDGRDLSEAAVVAELADHLGESPEGRIRTGLTTLLDCYVWTGLVERETGRYRLPGGAQGESGAESDDGDTLRVGLELSVDLDPEDLEGLVASLRRGLAADMDDGGESAPRLQADVSVGDDGDVRLEAQPDLGDGER